MHVTNTPHCGQETTANYSKLREKFQVNIIYVIFSLSHSNSSLKESKQQIKGGHSG